MLYQYILGYLAIAYVIAVAVSLYVEDYSDPPLVSSLTGLVCGLFWPALIFWAVVFNSVRIIKAFKRSAK